MKELNNRELAIVIWIGVILLLLLFKSGIRDSLISLLKAFLARKVIGIFILILIYSTCLVYLLWLVGYWKYFMLKDTIIWFFGVAFIFVFRITKGVNVTFFKNALKDSFKWTLILEFIANLYTFSLPIELALVLVLILLSAMKPIAEREEKFKQVDGCIAISLKVIFSVTILFTIYKTVIHFKGLFTSENARSILLSPILTAFYIPCLYLLAVIMAYESYLIILRFKTGDDEELYRSFRKESFKVARLNISKLNRMRDNIRRKDLSNVNNKKAFLKALSYSKLNIASN